MCELFAANSRRPLTLNAPLSTFFGDSEMHPHGWGLAVRDAQGDLELLKGPERASDSPLLAQTLSGPVASSHVLAHIRYATAGRLSYDNAHPFVGLDVTGREWALIHNGSIFHQDLIRRFSGVARGQSDSERVFLYLLERIDQAARAGGITAEARFEVLAQGIAALSHGNKLNLVLDDGTYTYVHTNTEDDTLFYRYLEDGVLVCTRPLDAEGWAPVPKRRLLAFRDGRLVRASKEASASYHFDERELNAFLLANAA